MNLCRFGNHPSNRSVIDDCATAGLKHVLNLILHRQKHTFKIDGDNLIERRFFTVREQSRTKKYAGVIKGKM